MPSSTISSTLINALTDLNVTGTLGPSQTRGRQEHTFHVRFNAESTAGAVMIEASFNAGSKAAIVFCVTAFGISSRRLPTAILASTLAMG